MIVCFLLLALSICACSCGEGVRVTHTEITLPWGDFAGQDHDVGMATLELVKDGRFRARYIDDPSGAPFPTCTGRWRRQGRTVELSLESHEGHALYTIEVDEQGVGLVPAAGNSLSFFTQDLRMLRGVFTLRETTK